MRATRAAVDEGIVPGGGVALLRARKHMAGLSGANQDQQAGINILFRALEEPLRQILINAGIEPLSSSPRSPPGKMLSAITPLPVVMATC